MINSFEIQQINPPAGDKDAKVIDTYDYVNSNCATETGNAAQQGGSSLDFKIKQTQVTVSSSTLIPTTNQVEDEVNTPKKMDNYLNTKSQTESEKVSNVTSTVKEELK